MRRLQRMVKTSICLHTLKSMSVILSLNLTVSLRTFSFSRQHAYLCLFFDLFYQLGIFSSLKVLVSSNLIYFCFEINQWSNWNRIPLCMHVILQTNFVKFQLFACNYLQAFSLSLWPAGFTAGMKTQANPDFLFCTELIIIYPFSELCSIDILTCQDNLMI